jgi:cobalamin biosynthesis protein CobT
MEKVVQNMELKKPVGILPIGLLSYSATHRRRKVALVDCTLEIAERYN